MSARISGRPLAGPLRTSMEQALGADLGSIRVHTGPDAGALAGRLEADAFTIGRDVYLPRGYPPASDGDLAQVVHELTHAARQGRRGQALVQRQRRGGGQPAPSAATDAQRYVVEVIEFLHDGAVFYESGPAVEEARLERRLGGWAAALSAARAAATGDQALETRLDRAYNRAVRALLFAAAARSDRTPRQLYLANLRSIDEAAWPRGSTDPRAGELSREFASGKDAHPASIAVLRAHVGDDLTRFFSTRDPEAVLLPPGVVVRFAGNVPAALRPGLQSVAGQIADTPLIVNSTTSLAIDTGVAGGRDDDVSVYRFTRVPGVKAGTSTILIERLGAAGIEVAGPTRTAAGQTSFEKHGFRRGDHWSGSDYAALVAAIASMPDALLSRIDGVTFERAARNAEDPKACGSYHLETHSITMYDCAFDTSATRFGPPGGGTRTWLEWAVGHETGHAIDRDALRAAMTNLEDAQRTQLASIADLRDPDTSGYRWSNDADGARYEAAMAQIKAAQAEVLRTRSLSGARWKLKGREFVVADEPSPDSEFQAAARRDGGVRITDYAGKNWSEFFAETFALYLTDPEELRILRPNLSAYFEKRLPRERSPAPAR
jgi:hypothetical protein